MTEPADVIITTPPQKNPKRIIVILSIVFIIITGVSLLIFRSLASSPPTTPVSLEPTPSLAPTAIPTPPKDAQALNILLLGYGGAGHQGGYLTDVLMLAHFNFDKRILAFISIPRDLWVSYPDGQNRKVNAAFALKTNTGNYTKEKIDENTAKNAGSAVKAVVETITGLPVNYFIGIDFSSFERTITTLGGIDVSVSNPLDDPWYPVRGLELELCGHSPETVTQMTATMSGFTLEKQFPCRYERIKYAKGTHHMSGTEALKFVRSRHSSSDFDRSLRQQAVLDALKNKLISLGALDKLPQFFTDLANVTRTDLNVDVIHYLTPTLKSIPGLKVINLNLSTQNVFTNSTSSSGAYILIPHAGNDNWAGVRQYIQQELNKQTTATQSTLPN